MARTASHFSAAMREGMGSIWVRASFTWVRDVDRSTAALALDGGWRMSGMAAPDDERNNVRERVCRNGLRCIDVDWGWFGEDSLSFLEYSRVVWSLSSPSDL